jgi:AbrB family looped-hinge helix DNA binding protein
MKISMDKAGRIIVPKPLRKRLGLEPGIELELLDQPGGVLLRPIRQRPSMVQVDGLWVHQGTAEPAANWERVLDEVREDRIQDTLKP